MQAARPVLEALNRADPGRRKCSYSTPGATGARQYGARAGDQPPRSHDASTICKHPGLPTAALTPVYAG